MLDVVLDKGIVIDAYVRVAVVGIELLTVDARIVIASVDTYLKFAEAVNRLDLQPQGQVSGLPGMMEEISEGGAQQKTKGALSGVKDAAKDAAKDALSTLTGNEDEASDEDDEAPRRQSRGRRSSTGSKSKST